MTQEVVQAVGHGRSRSTLSAEAAGATWSGGTYNGATWSGATWSGATWSGATWSNTPLNGATWSGAEMTFPRSTSGLLSSRSGLTLGSPGGAGRSLLK